MAKHKKRKRETGNDKLKKLGKGKYGNCGNTKKIEIYLYIEKNIYVLYTKNIGTYLYIFFISCYMKYILSNITIVI